MMFQTLVESLGGRVVTSATGYALVQAAMREHEALFGGEQSSHLSFADQYFGFDDGLYAAIRLLPTVSDIDERIEQLPKTHSTPELRIPVDENQKNTIMNALEKIISAPELLTMNDRHIIDTIIFRAHPLVALALHVHRAALPSLCRIS